MSTIRETPYIEKLLASMSEQNLRDLKTILDSGGDNVNLDFTTLTDSYKNKVTPVYFHFDDINLKTAILIWTDTKCALICYHRFQDLIIFELSPTYHTYTKIKEYCDINELRRVLDDTIEKTGAIDSGDAAEGTVPFADGEGGVTWDKPTEYIKGSDFEDAETTVKMVAIDDEGNLVKADLPEGTFVVDSALSNVSENPVQNKVITKALNDTVADIESGRIIVGKAQTAQALDNVSENSGSTQEDPFIAQGTGTNNNTSETPTSPKAHQLEKQGNTIAVNQQIQNGTFEDSTGWSANLGTIAVTDNKCTYTVTTQDTGNYINTTINVKAGHKYYLEMTATASKATRCGFYLGGTTEEGSKYDISANTKTIVRCVITAGSNNNNLYLYCNRTSGLDVNDTCIYENVYAVDLTQWGFDATTLTYLTLHPEAFINYYNGSLAYNAGQLANSDGQYLVTIGFNQWDEVAELGGIDSTTGENESSSTRIRSKNYIRIIPNTEYYLKGTYAFGYVMYYDNNKNYLGYITPTNAGNTVITTLNNATYLRFVTDTSYGTIYNNDICINLSWDSERDGEYQPYVKHTYNTGTETLLSAGNARDIKAADGTIIRNIGVVNLGTLNYTKYTTADNKTLFRATLSGIKQISASSIVANIFCALYPRTSVDERTNKSCSQQPNADTIDIIDNSYSSSTAEQFKTAMSGVYLNYELATPTTSSGTPFDEIIDVDDYGTMYWLDDNEDFVEIPQGCKLFYPADYALLIDDLGNYTNYDVTKLAKKSELDTAFETYLKGLTGYDATKTQKLQNVEGTLTWVDEE